MGASSTNRRSRLLLLFVGICVCMYVCMFRDLFLPQKEVQYLCSLFAFCRFVFLPPEVVAFSSLGL